MLLAGPGSAELQLQIDQKSEAIQRARGQLEELRRAEKQHEAEIAAAEQAWRRQPTVETGGAWKQARLGLEATTAQRARTEEQISAGTKALEALRADLAQTMEEEAMRAERAKPAWRSDEGYQKTLWGMSRRAVKKLYPRASGDKAIISVGGAVADLPAETSFYFAQDRLTDVIVRFRPVGKTRSEGEALEALRAALTEKYGELDDLERSALNGDPTISWSTEKTMITLQQNSVSVFDRLTLTYSSTELAFLRAKLNDQAKKDL